MAARSAQAEPEVADDRDVKPDSHRESPREQERSKTRRQPPYAVVLHNDDVNTFDFVVSVLQKVFRHERTFARRLTLEAHVSGRSLVWTGPLEVAELKADQIRSCGPDPEMKSRGALPLRTTIEPLPQ